MYGRAAAAAATAAAAAVAAVAIAAAPCTAASGASAATEVTLVIRRPAVPARRRPLLRRALQAGAALHACAGVGL